MRISTPEIGARHYQRPNQPWVCGLAESGEPCPFGPTAGGSCPALAECRPIRSGDRWTCNRSELRGGPCEHGPLPDGTCSCTHHCRPVRGLRARRARFVAVVAAAALGILLIMSSADWRGAVISPGALSRHHGQLLAPSGGNLTSGEATADCMACHTAADASLFAWTAAAFDGGDRHPTQSELCMKCHAPTISSSNALAAHSLSPEMLRQLTRLSASRATDPADDSHHPAPGERTLACSACHSEHHGADFDITAMGNASCQACHQERYQSFAADHPEFGDWPYLEQPKIAFDHAAHAAKHFAEKGQPFDCRRCHVQDAAQNVELLAGYEAACASCHDEKITTSVVRGIPFLSLPTLDTEALEAAGFRIADWPQGATGDFDGRLPPMMKLLLAADPAAAKAIEKLGADFDFYDVDPDDPSQLEACATLASSIRTLIAEFGARGPIVAQERITQATGASPSAIPSRDLLAGLSQDTLRKATAAWLEVPPQQPQAESTAPLLQPVGEDSPSYGPPGEWTYDEATLTLSYRPVTHADPVLSTWLSALSSSPAIESRPIPLAMFQEMTAPTAPGLCATCHATQRPSKHASGTSLAIHWRETYRGTTRGFTKFSHGPHLTLPQLADCTACHALADPSAPATSSLASHIAHSEFRPMAKHQCATCHTATGAGNRCQQCHHYHVDEIEAWRLDALRTSSDIPPARR